MTWSCNEFHFANTQPTQMNAHTRRDCKQEHKNRATCQKQETRSSESANAVTHSLCSKMSGDGCVFLFASARFVSSLLNFPLFICIIICFLTCVFSFACLCFFFAIASPKASAVSHPHFSANDAKEVEISHGERASSTCTRAQA